MPITPELLDELLKDYKSPEDMFGNDGLLQQLTKAVVERALQGEMTHHLGYEKHSSAGHNSGNSRNGKSKKTIKGKRGQIEIEVPRDRASEFEPQLIKRGQTRFDGFDERDHLLLRQSDDLPRDSSPSSGDLWCRSLTRPHLHCHGFSH